ncbi:recombination directionality factor [Streptosporangium canum]|uniref:recombination directionality factor n=1 Tax=Streptosporangium canum TaxID=324952 RepID=UPI0037922E43
MPIDPSVLQRRHWQDGRIRIGIKKVSQNGKTYPSKIETFRFTSPSKTMVEGAADLYGGQVRPWASPEGPQFEVVTEATRIPVVLPPNALSQNMEAWEGRVCIRRCTGTMMQPPFVGPCQCGPNLPIENRMCKPTTRLGVFLKAVRSLGLWRLDSKGMNAAAELPSAAEFLAHAGQYVDAWLFLTKRSGSFQGKPTSFVVPGLTIEGTSVDELMSGEVARRAELGRGETKAIEAAPATDYLAMIQAATNRDQVVAVWQTTKLDPAWRERAGEVEDAAKARVASFAQQSEAPAPATPKQNSTAQQSEAPALADDSEADQLRQQIISRWTGVTSELHAAFQKAAGSTMKNATIVQLKAFRDSMSPQPPAPAPAEDEDVVDAEIIEDEPTDKQLRELGILFTDCGITPHTGKGRGAKNDAARFAWLEEHHGVKVTSTKQLTAEKADEVLAHLRDMKIQAAKRRAADLKAIADGFDALKIGNADERLRDISLMLGRTITTPDDVTNAEVSDLVELLELASGDVAKWDQMVKAAEEANKAADA